MFRIKKWLWQKYYFLMGVDRAYAKYLAHFQHYQQHVVDRTLQQALESKPMTKEEFLKVWRGKSIKSSCKPGCCG